MANFHTNLLVVAASERDMLKVLRLGARNVLACADNTCLSLRNFEHYENAAALYRQLEGYLEGWYAYALSGASETTVQTAGGADARGLPEKSAVTWGANELGRAAIADGMGGLASHLGGLAEGPNVKIRVSMAPTARPLSDAADVRLDEYAGLLVLSMAYSTAWEPNSGDVDAFFELLETGDYGATFLDADEGDGYSEVSAFCGLHHGGRGLKDLDAPRANGLVDALELRRDAERYARVDREGIHDLAELAYAVAVCRWPEYESAQHARCCDEYYEHHDGDEEGDFELWYEKNYPQEIDYEAEYEENWRGGSGDGSLCSGAPFEGRSGSSLGSGRIDWIAPTEADLRRVGACLADMVRRLPIHAMLDDETHEVNQSAIASALAGDEVLITSTWSSSNPDVPVDLRVKGTDGVEFGYLGGGDLWSKIDLRVPTGDLLATIACLLPHLAARVDKAVPIALRSGHARHSIFIVRIELRDGSYERIEEDARALLSRPCDKRDGCSSVKRGC